MNSCWLYAGFVLVILACLATGISLVCPFWVKIGSGLHLGIWMVCNTLEDGQMVCGTTPLQDTEEVKIPAWFRACQALLSLGCLTLDAVLIMCLFLLCCPCWSKSCLIKVIVNLLTLSFLEVGVTVALFAGFMEGAYGVNIGWGLWVCCAGICCNLIALFMFIYLVCFKDDT